MKQRMLYKILLFIQVYNDESCICNNVHKGIRFSDTRNDVILYLAPLLQKQVM